MPKDLNGRLTHLAFTLGELKIESMAGLILKDLLPIRTVRKRDILPISDKIRKEGKKMFEPKKILVPTDFSVSSDKAIQEAFDIAEKFHSKVYVLHVIDKSVQQCAADYCLPTEVVEQFDRESENASTQKMKQEVARLNKTDAVEITYDVKKGVPYDEILNEQQQNNIDLIVLASHGRTGISRFMLGSVADKVLKKASAQVLLVRT